MCGIDKALPCLCNQRSTIAHHRTGMAIGTTRKIEPGTFSYPTWKWVKLPKEDVAKFT